MKGKESLTAQTRLWEKAHLPRRGGFGVKEAAKQERETIFKGGTHICRLHKQCS